jgi:hypothetical protein
MASTKPPHGTPSSGGARARLAARAARALPWLALGAGTAFLLRLLSLAQPGVHFSGDGGLKSLLVEQFARGELEADLRLAAEPWVRELWKGGYYPFEWPFTFAVGERTFAWCPLPFELLTAPAYAVLGWRGLYLWPVVGLVASWLVLWRLCARLALGPAWTALALAAVIFCSPITIYGATFWEHTLGVALVMGGLSLLVAPALREPARNGLLAGLVLGLAVWFRSELVWLTVVAAAILPFARPLGIDLRGRRWFFGGLALAGIGFLAWNAAWYGDPLGMTSQLLVGADHAPRPEDRHRIAWIFEGLMALLDDHGPIFALALVGAVAVHLGRRGSAEARAGIRYWALVGAAYVLGVVLVLSNAGGFGGKQFGPRYLLVAFPMAAVVLALSARALWERAGALARAALVAALAVGLGAGASANAVDGHRTLANDYALRIAPLLRLIRADAAEVVVATSQYPPQELASLFGAKRFFRAPDSTRLARLGFALASTGHPRFLVVSDEGPMEAEVPGRVRGDEAVLRLRTVECYYTAWCLLDAQVSPGRLAR